MFFKNRSISLHWLTIIYSDDAKQTEHNYNQQMGMEYVKTESWVSCIIYKLHARFWITKI